MRIIFVGTSAGARGTEQHLLELATGMRSRGHDVELFIDPRGYLAGAARQRNLRTSFGKFRNALDPRGWVPLLVRLVKCRPDVVVGSSGNEYLPITILGTLARSRVVLFRHLNSRLNVFTRNVLPSMFDRMVAVSEDMRRDLIMQGIPVGKVSTLYNPINNTRFSQSDVARDRTRTELGFAKEHFLVGFAGAMIESKGAPLLARVLNHAMAAEPHLRAAWLGPSDQHDGIRALVNARLLPRHRFVPWTDQIENFYPALDALAVPSQWREPFGRVSVEAQACGVPVIASDVGGLPETFAGLRDGLLPPTDEAAWAAALIGLARQSPEERAKRRESAVLAASRFATPRIAEEFDAILSTETYPSR